MKQYKYDFYIGLYDKDEKCQLHSNQYYYDTIARVLHNRHIDNYTITRAKGCYRNNREPSIIVTVIHYCEFTCFFQLIQADLTKLFNQASILVTKQELEVF